MALSDADKMRIRGRNPDGSLMNKEQMQASSRKYVDDAKAAEKGQPKKPSVVTDPDKWASPENQQKRAQDINVARQNMSEKDLGNAPKIEVYDPGDSDGDKHAVSPEDGNLYEGDPKSQDSQDDDPFKDTKAAWKHLTDVFGEKVSALQSELEGRLGDQLTPNSSEVNNKFANQAEVGADKELTLGDVKAAASSAADDAKAVASGIGEIGGAAASVAGNGVREGTRAAIKDMGYDPNDVGAAFSSVGKATKGLAGLFASGDSSNDKVPDSNWKPDTSKIPGIGSLFK